MRWGVLSLVAAAAAEEAPDTVRVTVSAAQLPGACSADVVPRFVAVPLADPLAGRTVLDTTIGHELQVVDCTVTPSPTRGLCVAVPLR